MVNPTLPEITPELVSENLEQYRKLMEQDHVKLEYLIQDLPKQALLRLVKLYTGCNIAREIIGANQLEFHPNEEKVIRVGMKLQDDCIGYLKLKNELNENQGESNGI